MLAHPACGWSYVGRICVDPQGEELRTPGLRPFVPYAGWILEEVLDLRALVATSAAMVERRLFDGLGGFNPAFLRCQDSDLWLRLAEASPAAVVPDILVHKRVHPEDRHTNQLHVLTYMNQIYDGVLRRTRSGRIRRRCRRQRAFVNLGIVDRMRGAGQGAEAQRRHDRRPVRR
jgi:GT2 family glycosyltransferase